MSNQAVERLTSVLLDDNNYNIWAKQVTFELVGRDKLEYVNGEISMHKPVAAEAPTEDEKRHSRSDVRMIIRLLGG
jgi:gag-polypeptide of LTR copia-type